MNRLMHVNPLKTAAALARVEDCAIDNVPRRPGNVRISADVGGVIAAELEVDGDNAVGGCATDGETSARGASEADLSDLGELDDGLELVAAAEVEDLEDVLGEAGVVECFLEAVADEGGLRGGLEEDRVAGEKRRGEGVDCDEPGELSLRQKTVRGIWFGGRLTFQADEMKTGPIGTLLTHLSNPSSAFPGMLERASSAVSRKYSARFLMVRSSEAAAEMGRPICEVSSFARTSS